MEKNVEKIMFACENFHQHPFSYGERKLRGKITTIDGHPIKFDKNKDGEQKRRKLALCLVIGGCIKEITALSTYNPTMVDYQQTFDKILPMLEAFETLVKRNVGISEFKLDKKDLRAYEQTFIDNPVKDPAPIATRVDVIEQLFNAPAIKAFAEHLYPDVTIDLTSTKESRELAYNCTITTRPFDCYDYKLNIVRGVQLESL